MDYDENRYFLLNGKLLPRFGALDRKIELTEEEKRQTFKAVIDETNYPSYLNYQTQTGDALQQDSWGTCYMMTSCNWVKWFVWITTGKKMNFSSEEWKDLAGDYQGISYKKRKKWKDDEGGRYNSIQTIFNFNNATSNHYWFSGKSEIVTEFVDQCSKYGISSGSLTGSEYSSSKKNAITLLNKNGPFYWGHNPLAYCNVDGSHAILVCGYDSDGVFFKNSWGSGSGSSHLGKCSWDNFSKYGHGCRPYVANMVRKL